jgi:hypothetical protein
MIWGTGNLLMALNGFLAKSHWSTMTPNTNDDTGISMKSGINVNTRRCEKNLILFHIAPVM